jgi:hypothetical protein
MLTWNPYEEGYHLTIKQLLLGVEANDENVVEVLKQNCVNVTKEDKFLFVDSNNSTGWIQPCQVSYSSSKSRRNSLHTHKLSALTINTQAD